jgi:hypothetical protein
LAPIFARAAGDQTGFGQLRTRHFAEQDVLQKRCFLSRSKETPHSSQVNFTIRVQLQKLIVKIQDTCRLVAVLLRPNRVAWRRLGESKVEEALSRAPREGRRNGGLYNGVAVVVIAVHDVAGLDLLNRYSTVRRVDASACREALVVDDQVPGHREQPGIQRLAPDHVVVHDAEEAPAAGCGERALGLGKLDPLGDGAEVVQERSRDERPVDVLLELVAPGSNDAKRADHQDRPGVEPKGDHGSDACLANAHLAGEQHGVVFADCPHGELIPFNLVRPVLDAESWR